MIAGKPVFYSLGNFVFDWAKMQSRHRAGIAVICDVSKHGLASVSIRPVWRGDTGRAFPAAPDTEEGAGIIRDVRERSERFSTRLSDTEDGLRVDLA